MITDVILSLLVALPIHLLTLITPYDFSIILPNDFWSQIEAMTKGAFYVLPIASLMPIFITRISLSIIKVIIAFVVRVKSFIPTYGS